jgi:hypothetical protein
LVPQRRSSDVPSGRAGISIAAASSDVEWVTVGLKLRRIVQRRWQSG